VLESHARGVPVITTRSAGFCPEFVQSFGGMSGLVFEPKDVNSEFFLNEVLHVIDNSDAYGEVCRSKASEFTEERVLGKLYSDIAVLAKGKGS
jgi:glycosyltransferase involved in cell wall biosynthesis